MSQRIYDPETLKGNEKKYKARFDQLYSHFGDCYRIFVADLNGFGYILGAGVAKLDHITEVPMIVVKLRFSQNKTGLIADNVIHKIENYLSSNNTEDLELQEYNLDVWHEI